jgi:cytochrome c biogenesis factor
MLKNFFLNIILITILLILIYPSLVGAEDCGEIIKPLSYFEKVSRYSLLICFGLFVIGILVDKRPMKITALTLSIIPLAVWGYVQFMVDFTELKKNVFAYNALAEGTLANIAEAQDRYKSEQGVYLKDLQELYSHVAGSHGINPCVRILKINAGFSQWIAEAKHVSSPDTIKWDSSSGSSLKKG